MCVCGGGGGFVWGHQIRLRSSDRRGGRARLNPVAVYLDIAAGWRVNSGKDSKCTQATEKPETGDLRRSQESHKKKGGISDLRSALCVTSRGANLQRTGTGNWSQICSATLKRQTLTPVACPLFVALAGEEGHWGPVNSGGYNSPQTLREQQKRERKHSQRLDHRGSPPPLQPQTRPCSVLC